MAHQAKTVNNSLEGNIMEITTHQMLVQAMETYVAEHTKFEEKGVKASAARARKALQEMSKAIKLRRAEITEKKNAL